VQHYLHAIDCVIYREGRASILHVCNRPASLDKEQPNVTEKAGKAMYHSKTQNQYDFIVSDL
ncbi:hypothetical protein AB4574_29185, partial [Vibrio sp. 10N.222.49.E5]|uniref:hypothetical protein n=1 Tax=Vibrio sp. 10N.222.49.E5 TaxID=3229617 RepID=UPI003551FCC6